MDAATLRKSYEILDRVMREGAYVNIELSSLADCADKNLIVKLVYGTLENYFECKYVAERLTGKPPKPKIRALLMQAIYALRHLEVAKYAVVNASVELVARIGKKELKGFVNAVLKRAANGEPTDLPEDNTPEGKEIKYNAPLWLIEKVESEGYAPEKIFLKEDGRKRHVRLTKGYAERDFIKLNPAAEVSGSGGYYVDASAELTKLVKEGRATYQSPSSMQAVFAFGDLSGKKFLDLCAAPGGKSVLAAELGADVTACDVHSHRVELIKAYAKRVGVEVKCEVSDGTVYREDFDGRFDCVLIDAPCSGIGVISSRPDIVLTRKPEDIAELAAIQKKLLDTGARYVRKGGILVYSTCTLLKEENDDQIDLFVKNNEDFGIQGYGIIEKGSLTILPDDRMDGFYIARMVRKV